MSYLWGIDLGGTKIEGVILDRSNLTTPILRRRIATEAHKGYQNILNNIQKLVEELSQQSNLRPETIGFGTPGITDSSSGLMKNSNTICLNGMPLKADIESLLGFPIKMANDANCFTLAENRLGAGQGAESVFGIILGTGVGGGIVINEKIVHGFHGIAGEWGHNILIENATPCYCGKRGCVETVISGPALEAYYQSLTKAHLPLSDIVIAAKNGQNQFAEQTLRHLYKYFALAISVVINILDPEIIIIGGGVSNIDDLYIESKKEISKYIFNNTVSTKLVRNSLGDSAGVFGAAMMMQ